MVLSSLSELRQFLPGGPVGVTVSAHLVDTGSSNSQLSYYACRAPRSRVGGILRPGSECQEPLL